MGGLDWNAIGTWVGGIGSAAAAITAVYISRSEANRRKNFSKFLMSRDLERVERITKLMQNLLRYKEVARNLSGEDLSENLSLQKECLKYIAKNSSDFEYFNNSEQLYSFRPMIDSFSILQSEVRSLVDFEDQIKSISDIVGEENADLHFAARTKVIRDALINFNNERKMMGG